MAVADPRKARRSLFLALKVGSDQRNATVHMSRYDP